MVLKEFIAEMHKAVDTYNETAMVDPYLNEEDASWSEWCEWFCDFYIGEIYTPSSTE